MRYIELLFSTMPHVSQKKMNEAVARDVLATFTKTLCELHGSGGEHFLSELLTDTEKLMLAKRLAIVMLLDADYSQYRIRKDMAVSASTVARLYKQLDAGLFDAIRAYRKRKENAEKLWQLAEQILYVGMHTKGMRPRRGRRVPRTPYRAL